MPIRVAKVKVLLCEPGKIGKIAKIAKIGPEVAAIQYEKES